MQALPESPGGAELRRFSRTQKGGPERMSEEHVTVYTPGSRIRSPWTLLKDMGAGIMNGRELAWRLAVRDISAQYRQTALGLLWALILPLANTLTWIFLNGTGIVSIRSTALPYPVYVFTGTMLWSIFMDALNAPLQQTMAARSMLAKINFPREAIILSGIYQTMFNGAIKIGLMAAALPVLGIFPDWHLILFPLGVLSLILAGTTIGLVLTPIGLLYTDIGRGLPLVMQFLMYVTPVVFSMPETGWTAVLFRMNPISSLILTTRDWLTGFTPEYLMHFLLVSGTMVLLLFLVVLLYRLVMPILIERMSA